MLCIKPLSSIKQYLHVIAVTVPVKITMWIAPLLPIPPHILNFVGCFALGLNFLPWPLIQKHNFPWLSNCAEHSSLNNTFLTLSFTVTHFLTSWQYLDLFIYLFCYKKSTYLLSCEFTILCHTIINKFYLSRVTFVDGAGVGKSIILPFSLFLE